CSPLTRSDSGCNRLEFQSPKFNQDLQRKVAFNLHSAVKLQHATIFPIARSNVYDRTKNGASHFKQVASNITRLASCLGLIPRTKPRRTGGWRIAAVLRDVPLEHAKNMVIPDDVFLPVGTGLQSFRVSVQKSNRLGAIRDQYHRRFV